MTLSPAFVLLCVGLSSSALGAVTHDGVVVPTYTTPCKRNSPDFDRCIQIALQSLIPKLAKNGIPEIELDSIDPLYVPEMVFNYDSLPDITGKLDINDTVVRGIGTLKITGVRSSIHEGESFSMDIDFHIPKVTVRGQFSMNGFVGKFPVSGNGPYNLTTGQVKGTWKLRGIIVTQHGQEYIKLLYFGMSPDIGYFKVHAENLFEGNPELSSMIVAFTNRFWLLLYNQSLPYFERNFDILGRDVLNKIFLKIPFNQLFPKA